MKQPDDVLFTGSDVLVGEYGDGRIARLGQDASHEPLDVLPFTVPEVEGLAQYQGVLYAASQATDQVEALGASGASAVFSLQPVAGIEGVDGLAAGAQGLLVPDSPHGRLLFVSLNGSVTRTVSGFARPTGAWQEASGSVLVADENAGEVLRVSGDGTRQVLASGLPLVDDVVEGQDGQIFAISITNGAVYSIAGGGAQSQATGLQQPQGLAEDGAGNLLVTDYVRGNLDALVRTFKLQPALASPQPAGTLLCVSITRAPHFASSVTLASGSYPVARQIGTGLVGAISVPPCSGTCRVLVTARQGQLSDSTWIDYTG